MDPEPLKPAWQAQPGPAIDPERLLAEVRRDRVYLSATLFWRDLREFGVSLLMIPVWVYLGSAGSLPWTWYLMVPALIWVAGFLLVDRLRYPQRPIDPGEPLVRCVEGALAQVEHQIRLLRNVGWWYLLPLAVPMMAFVAQVNWRLAAGGWAATAASLGVGAVVGLVLAGVYRLNQVAVRDEFEPRRRKLQTLLAGLQDPLSDSQESPR